MRRRKRDWDRVNGNGQFPGGTDELWLLHALDDVRHGLQAGDHSGTAVARLIDFRGHKHEYVIEGNLPEEHLECGGQKGTFYFFPENQNVPSLKEPVLSRVVSADFVAWECLLFLCVLQTISAVR